MKVRFNTNQQAGYVIRLESHEINKLYEKDKELGKTKTIPQVLEEQINKLFNS